MANIDSAQLPNGNEYNLQDNISGYAHKVASPTADNLASLDSNGDIADSGIAKGDVIQSNPNLLDNAWFTVNEGGQSSYNGGGITFNRWVLSGATNAITQNADGSVTVAKGTGITQATFYQRIETDRYSGHDITVSMLLGDDTVRKGTAHYVAGTAVTIYTDSDIVVSFDSGNAIKFDVKASSMTFKCLKAEIGKVSTILLDGKPEYAFELAKCQTSNALYDNLYSHKGNIVTSNSIAPTEDGATASKAYVVGEPFFRGGDFCKCISPIASGGSFTLNTNYAKIDVADILEYICKGGINIPLEIVNDLNAIDGDYTFNVSRWETSSTHTPYSESATIYGSGIVIAYQIPVGGGYYSVQMSLVVGENKMFIRSRAGGSWTSWTAIQ